MVNTIRSIGNWLYHQMPSSTGAAVGALGGVGITAVYRLGELIGEKTQMVVTRLSFFSIPRSFAGAFSIISIPVAEVSRQMSRLTEACVDRISQNAEYRYFGKRIAWMDPNNPNLSRSEIRLLRCATYPPISSNLTAPLVEEFIYRLPLLLTSGHTRLALSILSSIMFVMGHEFSQTEGRASQYGRRAGLMAMGLTLAWITSTWGLIPAIMAHAGYNTMEWVLSEYQAYQEREVH